jgi:hypothetical protein
LTRRTCRRAHSPGTNQRAAAEGLSLCQQLAIGKYTFSLLLGVVCGLLAGLVSYYVLTLKSDPRKAILLGIKTISSTLSISR